MQVSVAKAAARRWVEHQARDIPGYAGAFFHGSANWLAGDDALPATSDLDLMVVLDETDIPGKPGKLTWDGVVLEVSYIGRHELESAEQVLQISHLAGSFSVPSIIDDPSGRLGTLQREVAAHYAERRWVRARCEHVVGKLMRFLGGIDPARPFHDQVMPWLFGTSLTTHMLLAAGLRNPTVRRRYVAARKLLIDYGQTGLYPTLLEQLGCAGMDRADVQKHIEPLGRAFDAAAGVIRSPLFFAADLGEHARPIAIDGSRELIARDLHREAIFWIVATYSRCMIVFERDAPALTQRFEPAYRRLLAELGITRFEDMQQRGEQVVQSLTRVREVAEAIIAANPEIRN